jgi:hypothetical protein
MILRYVIGGIRRLNLQKPPPAPMATRGGGDGRAAHAVTPTVCSSYPQQGSPQAKYRTPRPNGA